MHRLTSNGHRRLAALVALALIFIGVPAGAAMADSAPIDPADPATPATVTADPLPTVQIDGVVWSQVVVGRTVYVAGSFSTARPAGSAPGVNTVPRANLLAYNIDTGVLVPGFAPVLNGQARAIAASPDGSRIYVVGDFTQVNGEWRVKAVAFDTATGNVVPSFRPTLASNALAVAASNTTVYIGGDFRTAASVTGGTLVPRAHLAAFNASNGALTDFVADANAPVTALALTTDGGRLAVGGRFTSLAGSNFYGLGSVDPATGAAQSFPVNAQVRNAGTSAGITSLTATDQGIYGTGYHFGSGGNLEGTFRADAATGEVIWIADCHGDAYSSYPSADVVYVSSHHHYCGNMGGFPQSQPWTMYHANAFSQAVTGVNTPDIYGYPDHPGQPAPSWLNWYPTFAYGSYTGQAQSTWHVTGNEDFVIYGGEFPSVNSAGQQGIVRFAKRPVAPGADGPRLNGAAFNPSVRSILNGSVRVTFSTNFDRDNKSLTYRVYRGSENSAPIYTETITTPFWSVLNRTVTDSGLTPGSTQQYRVTATDPDGNLARSEWVTVTVNSGAGVGAYAGAVIEDDPQHYWRLDESSGTAVVDLVGGATTTAGSGLTRNVVGALAGDANTATRFSGTTTGFASTRTAVAGPNVFSTEAWFRVGSSGRGKLIGFGSAATGNSSSYDRHVYMRSGGQLTFGAYTGTTNVVTSAGSYNDDQWHHVVATLGADGMKLYVDGELVGSRPETTSAEAFTGYWRIGGDNLGSWPGEPSSPYFNGTLDEVAVYARALDADTVTRHFTVGQTGSAINRPPVASFTAQSQGLDVSLDASESSDPDGAIVSYVWDFGDGEGGSGVSSTHAYGQAGTYVVTLTVTDDAGASTATTRSVTATEPPPNQVPVALFTVGVAGLTVSVDGSGSSDPDGSVVDYVWDFGDGQGGSGVFASHTYAEAGTYEVALTVTDDAGGSASVSQVVTVEVPAVFAQDAFERAVTGGWGEAEVGGAWTRNSNAVNYLVDGGRGQLPMQPGNGPRAQLAGAVAVDVDLQTAVAFDKRSSVGAVMSYVMLRTSGWNEEYRAKVIVAAGGAVDVELVTLVGNTETALGRVNVPGLTYSPGEVLQVRVQAQGTDPTTLRVKVWRAGSAEPSVWHLERTDSTGVLQNAGGVGLGAYLSAAATNAPVTASFDNLIVGRPD
ncbi:MAG: PKD domain-containing protein [Cellulomonadaceae bacterium]